MKLSDIIDPNNIIVPIKSTIKEHAIQELLRHMEKNGNLSSTAKLNDFINSQEKAFSSAAGKGVAFPSCGSIEVENVIAVLGVSKNGVAFNAPDGLKCHLILLTLSSKKDPTKRRRLVHMFQDMISNIEIKYSMMEDGSVESIHNTIIDWEQKNMENL
ncbi:MAG: hypothetical protein CBD58_03510 [bacterium TMED198]|nr:MAG: hypothetical protein CBD58_03510 [bacterium TMED198]|tara:strand:- start:209 stop:682 length:474 start_codon:yes stop_codon:yes gene_type:complete